MRRASKCFVVLRGSHFAVETRLEGSTKREAVVHVGCTCANAATRINDFGRDDVWFKDGILMIRVVFGVASASAGWL